jgi:hypothetical protein
MRRFTESPTSIPLLFAFVTVIAYGLLLPFTGFYWDDWPFAWIARFLGPKEFFPAFSGVRPFLAPIFYVTTSLIPPIPAYWQAFSLIVRFASGLSAWFALNQIFPHHKRQTLIASLLFLVFPGYSQHWVAFTHINQEWIPFIFYLLSFGYSARALRKSTGIVSGNEHPRNDMILALLFLTAGVFPTEYFIGLEPLRFLFIWVIISQEVTGRHERFVRSLKYWLPYLLIWLANAAWLAYFYTMGSYESYDVEVISQPLTIVQLLFAVIEAIWKAGFYIWLQMILLAWRSITAPSTLLTLGLVGVTFVLFLFYFSKTEAPHGESKTFAVYALVIGLAGILLGRVPSIAAGLPLTLQSSYDRFMISMMIGGSLFATGLIELLFRNPRVRNSVFAALIALGIGQQFFNANIFRRDWAKQQEIYWQLAWRIPAMQPDTALLTDQMPIDYETDLSFTAPINWMYAPDYTRSNVPYALIYTEKRLGRGALPSLKMDVEINLSLRTVEFHGSTSQAIVIHMPKNGCLRVLDPDRGDEITYGRGSRFLVEAIPLSDPSRIIVDATETATVPFIPEPEHTWCYYYSKAELARQQGDWGRAADLMARATSLGYKPEDSLEWLTYIEAQAMAGNIEAAQQKSDELFADENGIRRGLCQVWKRIQIQIDAGGDAGMLINRYLSELQCAR